VVKKLKDKGGREAEIDSLLCMVVTLDTSHDERSPLNPAAYPNA
jgi:hypothetical protein